MNPGGSGVLGQLPPSEREAEMMLRIAKARSSEAMQLLAFFAGIPTRGALNHPVTSLTILRLPCYDEV